jgi:putative ABC transport system permease protein
LINKLVIENLKHRPRADAAEHRPYQHSGDHGSHAGGSEQGMLDEQARRARGIGADIIIRPPNSSAISNNGNMPAAIIPKIIDVEPHVAATAEFLYTQRFSQLRHRRRSGSIQ